MNPRVVLAGWFLVSVSFFATPASQKRASAPSSDFRALGQIARTAKHLKIVCRRGPALLDRNDMVKLQVLPAPAADALPAVPSPYLRSHRYGDRFSDGLLVGKRI